MSAKRSRTGSSADWILIRAGALFGVLWLAYPQLSGVPRSVWIGILILILVLARMPKLFPIALAVLLAILILRPRRR